MTAFHSPGRIACACLLALATTWPVGASDAGPHRYAHEALGQDGRITLTPTFTPDERTMYFSQSECTPIWQCPQRLKRSTLGPDGWSTPEVVPLPRTGRVDYPSVTPDGRYLLFSWAVDRARHEGRDVYEDFDIYRLDLGDPDATPVAIDEPDINRIRGGAIRKRRFVNNETAPVLTAAGDLYFWTERLDGIGERDVYVAPGDGNGGFLAARPLPAPINSAGRDDGAWINAAGDLMLVTYSDRGGEGGADLFVSHKRDGAWSTPVNLGPTVNSPADDFAGMITPDGGDLLFSSTRPVPGQPQGLVQVWVQAVQAVPVLCSARDGSGC